MSPAKVEAFFFMTTYSRSPSSAALGLAVKVVQGRITLHRINGVYLRSLCF